MATVSPRQKHRNTTIGLSTKYGKVGEIAVDTDKNVVVVMDGITAGGHPMAKNSQVIHDTGDEDVYGIKDFKSSPLAPTPAINTNNTQVATTEFVQNAILKPITETLVYLSATSFKITGVGDLTDVYKCGDKLRVSNNGVKYFYIYTVSYNSYTDTNTFVITGGDDYVLESATITNAVISRNTIFPGFPEWFNYTPTATGVSAQSDTNRGRFQMNGRSVTLVVWDTGGTSNSSGFTVSLPVKCAAYMDSSGTGKFSWSAVGWVKIDGSFSSTLDRALINPTSDAARSIAIIWKGNSDAGFPTSGTKSIYFEINYEA